MRKHELVQGRESEGWQQKGGEARGDVLAELEGGQTRLRQPDGAEFVDVHQNVRVAEVIGGAKERKGGGTLQRQPAALRIGESTARTSRDAHDDELGDEAPWRAELVGRKRREGDGLRAAATRPTTLAALDDGHPPE